MSDHLPSLAPLGEELSAILDQELASGNRVVLWRRGWNGGDSTLVLLQNPPQPPPRPLPAGIAFSETADPEWWKVEYIDERSRDCISCGF